MRPEPGAAGTNSHLGRGCGRSGRRLLRAVGHAPTGALQSADGTCKWGLASVSARRLLRLGTPRIPICFVRPTDPGSGRSSPARAQSRVDGCAPVCRRHLQVGFGVGKCSSPPSARHAPHPDLLRPTDRSGLNGEWPSGVTSSSQFLRRRDKNRKPAAPPQLAGIEVRASPGPDPGKGGPGLLTALPRHATHAIVLLLAGALPWLAVHAPIGPAPALAKDRTLVVAPPSRWAHYREWSADGFMVKPGLSLTAAGIEDQHRPILTYRASEGDTLRALATQYGLTVNTLIWSNPGAVDILQHGQVIMIPP